MKTEFKFWWKSLALGLLLILGYKLMDNYVALFGFFSKLVSILTPFIIGGVLAFFMYKPVKALEGLILKLKLKIISKYARTLSTLLAYFVVIFIVFKTFGFLLPEVIKNIQDVINKLPKVYSNISEFINSNEIISNYISFDKVFRMLESNLNIQLVGKYINVIGDFSNSILAFFVGIVISIYILIEKESLYKLTKRLMCVFIKSERMGVISIYFRRLVKLFYSYFTGLAIDAILVGVIATIFLLIAKVPYAYLLGIIIAIGNLVPFFGPLIAAIVVYIVTSVSIGPINALWILLFQVILGQVDGNIIQPRIISNSVEITPFWVMFAIILFGGLFGTIGMFIGVPIIAVLRIVVNDYLDDKKIDGIMCD